MTAKLPIFLYYLKWPRSGENFILPKTASRRRARARAREARKSPKSGFLHYLTIHAWALKSQSRACGAGRIFRNCVFWANLVNIIDNYCLCHLVFHTKCMFVFISPLLHPHTYSAHKTEKQTSILCLFLPKRDIKGIFGRF